VAASLAVSPRSCCYEAGKASMPLRISRTKFQESFKFPPNRASPIALTPQRESSEATDRLHVGGMVPVRGFEPRSRG
jgi:hypothetical protein